MKAKQKVESDTWYFWKVQMRCVLVLKVTPFLKDKMFIFAEGPSFWTKKNELFVAVYFTFYVSFFFNRELQRH